jgi:hypothetical protein
VDHLSEESQADVLWAFMDRLRGEENPRFAGMDRITSGDARELAAMFGTAVALRETMEAEDRPPAASVAVRVSHAIQERKRQTAPLTRPRRWALPQLRAGWAAAAAALLVVGIAAGAILLRDPLTAPPPDIRALDHPEAHQLAARIQAPGVADADARATLWHLAHCSQCYAAFRVHQAAARAIPSRPGAVPAAVPVGNGSTVPACPANCPASAGCLGDNSQTR